MGRVCSSKKREYIEVTEIESVGEGFQKIKELDYYQWSDENENKAFAYGNYIAGKLYRKMNHYQIC